MKKSIYDNYAKQTRIFGRKINLVEVNIFPKRFRTHDPRFASFILLPLTYDENLEKCKQ